MSHRAQLGPLNFNLMKIFFKATFLCLCEGVWPACVSVYHTCACAQGSQKRVSDPHHVGAGNQTGILGKNSWWS